MRRHRSSGLDVGPGARGLFVAGRSGNVSLGLILIAAGVLLTLHQQDLLTRGFWREGWPWIIVFLAAVQIVTARTASRLGDGVAFGLVGVWLWMVQTHWHGFTWRNSWPLALAAAGVGMVVHAIASLFMRGPRAHEPEEPVEGPHHG